MRYTVISFIVLLCWVFDTHAQQYHISTDHPAVTFEKENPLFLSIYSWPETLISYPVTFSPDSNVENRLELIDTRTGSTITIVFALHVSIFSPPCLPEEVLSMFCGWAAGR